MFSLLVSYISNKLTVNKNKLEDYCAKHGDYSHQK